ncbi:hypothetical protein HYQ44_017295 [Verticillium longisporum]|nr:hypothetical protein HYQ44_017295 [Verticillium longisporum]
MKWEDISKRLPGRSAISCRLHYQNYLERRSEWDEEKKTKLARLYERLKPEMWAKLAEEMAVPWRAAEAMHWQLGEADIARRNGVTPFSLAAVNVEQPQQSQPPLAARNSPSRQQHHHHHHHAHSHSQGSIAPPPQARFPRAGGYSPLTGSRRRESLPPPPPPQVMQQLHQLHEPGPGLAPIQSRVGAGGGIGGGGALPGLAELTTGAEHGGRKMGPAGLESLVVSDAEAAMACVRFAHDARFVVEVACGATVAVCYNGALRERLGRGLSDDEWRGKNVVVVVCGGSNVSLEVLEEYKATYAHMV